MQCIDDWEKGILMQRFVARWMSLLSLIAVVGTCIAPRSVYATTSAVETILPSVTATDTSLYRARITIEGTAAQALLTKKSIVILEQTGDYATVLVSAPQLAQLARLRFQPQDVSELSNLIDASPSAQGWLKTSVKPLLAYSARLSGQVAMTQMTAVDAPLSLEGALASLSFEQQIGIAALSVPDDDNDGLSNEEEGFWCTNPKNANTDGDAQGYKDGMEVQALLDFRLPRTTRWSYRAPFGPPNAWPDWNGDDGNANTPACNDGDHDTIPDFAEAYIVGSDPNVESTDRDKFDDGQELFGVTHCRSGTTNCGYGSYPAIEYWNFIQAQMPGWVRSPGDNIFVAAFPVPEISVVPDSWKITRVATITTSEGEMTETSNTYETSVTQGQSSSIANSKTWNNWEEVSEAVERPLGTGASSTASFGSIVHPLINWGKAAWGTVKIVGGGLAVAAGCTVGQITVVGCAAGVTAAAVGFKDGYDDWVEATKPDDVQKLQGTNTYKPSIINQASSSASSNSTIVLNQNFDTQGIVRSLDGVQHAINRQGDLISRGLHDVSYAISQPRITESRANGKEWGGSQTTTHEEYEEHTVTQGQQFTTGRNWSTAWASDTSRAADLTFNYTIKNTGTDYARVLNGIKFNIFIGDDTLPAITYDVDSTFNNHFPRPSDDKTFASRPQALTLDQMRRIDLGEPIRVALEDFSYDSDELFYQDATDSGITVLIEDGVEDGDETVDSYVIPTWGNESMQDVLKRYFPSTDDAEGNLNALWTPEINGTSTPVWNEHYLSDIAWWNIYMSQPDAGDTSLKDLPAVPGSAMLFRFNRDSDRDGYNDRVEMQYETDKTDPLKHPEPKVSAGYIAKRTGNTVSVNLVLENAGSFDAYGIDAVMYAPDGTTTITNNTVGGNGRVRHGGRVVVGSLVKPPVLAAWGSGTAQPYAAGNYSGTVDRTYTFTVKTPGVVGRNTTAMNWTDNMGATGTVELGSTYHAPLPVVIAQGVQLGFNTGTIIPGASFSIDALTPRDTFSYTINSPTYTEPVIVVSYSDPQGSHRFITPVKLDNSDSPLAPHASKMLQGGDIQIVTPARVVTSGNNTTNVVFNNPHPKTVSGARLYLNFVSDGRLVKEIPVTTDILSGPTVYPVVWSTSSFSETYQATADNILVAFWTDRQGNIIDSAARPLNTFVAEPTPTLAIAAKDTTWDFGTVVQGEQPRKTLTFANAGRLTLSTALVPPTGIMFFGDAQRKLIPGDMTLVSLILDTRRAPVGVYDRTMLIRTNDPVNPVRSIRVKGIILQPGPAVTQYMSDMRPWDRYIWVPGNRSQRDIVDFAHRIPTDAAEIEPMYLYSSDRTRNFGYGAALAGFGDGRNGDLVLAPGSTIINTDRTSLNANQGSTVASVATTAGFESGDLVLLHQTQGTSNLGRWEYRTVKSVDSATQLSFTEALRYSYTSAGVADRAQMIGVPQYRNIVVETTRWLQAPAWDGTTGGILAFMANGTVQLDWGLIATASGYRGGQGGWGNYACTASQGESYSEPAAVKCTTSNGGGGAGPDHNMGFWDAAGGGGGAYATAGTNGTDHGTGGINPSFGVGGSPYADGFPNALLFGSGGGGGGGRAGQSGVGGSGGDGGGIVIATMRNVVFGTLGHIAVNGDVGDVGITTDEYEYNRGASGGGGAGGSIKLRVGSGDFSCCRLSTRGGNGGEAAHAGGAGGAGGSGRSILEYQHSPSTPTASIAQQVDMYVAEKTADDRVRLTIPESFSGNRTYWLQYGQRYTYPAAGVHVFHARLPKGRYANLTLDTKLTSFSSPFVNFCLSIGNKPTCDYAYQSSYTGSIGTTTPNIAAAVTNYLATATPDADNMVVVPFRVTLNAGGELFLTNLVAKQDVDVDAVVSATDLTFSHSTPTEGQNVVITSNIRNTGGSKITGVTANFYAQYAGEPEIYLGSAFVPSIPAKGLGAASIIWNTTAGAGNVVIRVAVDPLTRLAEIAESNNTASKTLTVLTRPDLLLTDITLTDNEPVVGQATSVKVVMRNQGQGTAGTQTVTLYQRDSAGRETEVGSQTQAALAGNTNRNVPFTWTPMTPGAYSFRARVDRTNVITESNEQNNTQLRDVYVGFQGSIMIDSGTSSDTAYTAARGYGFVDTAPLDTTHSCGSRTYKTLRVGSPKIAYRFDHLLPGHAYNLDLTLYKCDLSGRVQSIYVDGIRVAGPIDLSDGIVRSVSLLLNPALYADKTISVSIEATGVAAAVVGEVNLHNVDARYSDAGGANDPAYSSTLGYGWIGGSIALQNDPIPYRSLRINQTSNKVQYRYDRLLQGQRYRVKMSFWQPPDASNAIQKVQIDGFDVGPTFSVTPNTLVTQIFDVPSSAFSSDGTLLVAIIRTDAADGAFVNEITLEQQTSVIPAPTLTSVSPTSVSTGGSAFVLTINGANFIQGSTVYWNGAARSTSFVNTTQLRANITAADIANRGTATITVVTPAPGGGTSEQRSYTIN